MKRISLILLVTVIVALLFTSCGGASSPITPLTCDELVAAVEDAGGYCETYSGGLYADYDAIAMGGDSSMCINYYLTYYDCMSLEDAYSLFVKDMDIVDYNEDLLQEKVNVTKNDTGRYGYCLFENAEEQCFYLYIYVEDTYLFVQCSNLEYKSQIDEIVTSIGYDAAQY